MVDQDIKNRVIQTMGQKQIIGKHNRTKDYIANLFPTHEQGKVKDAIDELISDPNSPVQKYGGQRNSIRLTSAKKSTKIPRKNQADIPWRLKE